MRSNLFVLSLVGLWAVAAGISAENSFLPTIEDTLKPREWLYVGPFSVGAREGIVGLVDDLGKLRPREGLEHKSILPQGGTVRWKKASVDSLGWLNLEYEDVYWDTLMDIWGIPGIVSAGYAYTEFRHDGRKRALVEADRPGSFLMNGVRYYGNPYGEGHIRIPVIVGDGGNTIMVGTSGYGDHRLKFRLVPAQAPLVIVGGDATLPDLVEGELVESWAGITLMNTTEIPLDGLEIAISSDGVIAKGSITGARIEPLSCRKFPIPVKQIAPCDTAASVQLLVEAKWNGDVFTEKLDLRVKGRSDSRVVTFMSAIDSSCQYYAVLPPAGFDPAKDYALILTLHGAGVMASGQVDSYKPKDWAFVVAPTNRGRYGFDWQDWGRLDALEVLELAKSSFPIDTNRIYLAGHSMGGHGTWHVGLAHPHLFAAMAPAAGWTCFQLYVPWFLQKAYLFGEPGLTAIRDMSLREDFTPDFVQNALNLPVFILHGGIDDNVPTVHGRMFASLLDELGYRYRYKEVPGMRHWWSTDGIQCVDDPDLLDFLKAETRDPCPHRIVFKTNSIAQSNTNYWMEILRQDRPFFESRVEAEVNGRSIAVRTSNVGELALTLSRGLMAHGEISISIDGKKFAHDFLKDEKVFFHKERGQFKKGQSAETALVKRPELYGPMKQAYFSPFALVYGTKGDSSTSEMLYRSACYESMAWWHRANGCSELLPDSEVTEEVMLARNLILFGGRSENLVTERIEKSLPIRVRDGEIMVGDRVFSGGGLAAEFVYPNPLSPNKLVFVHEGSDSAGLAISTTFGALYSGAGLPDYVVFDAGVKKLGWAGVLCAGFFGNNWQVDERLMYSVP